MPLAADKSCGCLKPNPSDVHMYALWLVGGTTHFMQDPNNFARYLLYTSKYLVVWSRGWWCGAFISKAEADSNLEEEAVEEEDKGGSLPSFSAFLPYSTRTHNTTFISLTLHTICSIKKSIP